MTFASGKGACGQASVLRWSGRRCATTALRCSVSWPVAELTALSSFAAFKQAATSQITMRAARAATSPVLLGAPEARSSLPARAFAATSWLAPRKAALVASRQAVPGGGAVCGDEERRFEVGARSALRQLTCRGCLSAVSEASSAARPRNEHRSAVDAQHRPPQHEPPPAAACRDATLAAKQNSLQLPALFGSRHTRSNGKRQAFGAISWWIGSGPTSLARTDAPAAALRSAASTPATAARCLRPW